MAGRYQNLINSQVDTVCPSVTQYPRFRPIYSHTIIYQAHTSITSDGCFSILSIGNSTLPQRRFQMAESKFVDLGDARLHYVEAPSPGPVLLLLHGVTDSLESYL